MAREYNPQNIIYTADAQDGGFLINVFGGTALEQWNAGRMEEILNVKDGTVRTSPYWPDPKQMCSMISNQLSRSGLNIRAVRSPQIIEARDYYLFESIFYEEGRERVMGILDKMVSYFCERDLK
ncbi:hypothetical protein HN747_01630 [archaeon]|jgi:hypothetical protein|nr:hypothetical protein [archaeon]